MVLELAHGMAITASHADLRYVGFEAIWCG